MKTVPLVYTFFSDTIYLSISSQVAVDCNKIKINREVYNIIYTFIQIEILKIDWMIDRGIDKKIIIQIQITNFSRVTCGIYKKYTITKSLTKKKFNNCTKKIYIYLIAHFFCFFPSFWILFYQQKFAERQKMLGIFLSSQPNIWSFLGPGSLLQNIEKCFWLSLWIAESINLSIYLSIYLSIDLSI